MVSDWLVSLSGGVESLLSVLSLNLTLGDLLTQLLRRVENIDGVLIVQNVTLCIFKHSQNRGLSITHSTLILVLSQNQLFMFFI